MPIDTSIYQNLRPVEMTSPLVSMGRAANLSHLAMQNQRMGQQMENEEKEANAADHLRRASVFGNALESISRLQPEERAASYSQMRNSLVKEGVISAEQAPEQYDDGFYRQTLMRYRQTAPAIEQRLKMAQIGKMKAETAKDYAIAKGKGMIDPVTGQVVIGQKMLPSDKVLSVNEGKQIPRMLEDISGTITANADIFGPVSGHASALNPWNEKAATIDAQMRAGSQSFGRYMEGGVLRKEDEEKYRKMFPQLSDTPKVAANKLAIVDRLLKSKSAADVKALAASGYDTNAFRGMDTNIPDVPETLRGGSGGIINEAMADDHGQTKKPSGVRMMGPDGKVRVIPESMVGEAIASGGKKVK